MEKLNNYLAYRKEQYEDLKIKMENNRIDKIGNYEMIAEPFHVDFNGELTLGVLGNHLLNCASFHSADRVWYCFIK